MATRRSALLLVSVAAITIAGCGRSQDRSTVRTTTERFLRALAAHDGTAACRRLSADTRAELESSRQHRCADAVGELKLAGGSIRRVEVDLTSAKVDLSGSPRWARARGWRLKLYSNSLVLVMTLIWLGSWGVQSVAGRAAYNAEQFDHQLAGVSWVGYVISSDFWNRTLQNWQSEFLAVGSMAILSIYLRQRGSPESKPVGAPHDATGVEG